MNSQTTQISEVHGAFNSAFPISEIGKRALANPYVRGFLDGYLGRPHNDGRTPPHSFQICIPTGDPYRSGYLDGLNER
jgi:hypothetical protein